MCRKYGCIASTKNVCMPFWRCHLILKINNYCLISILWKYVEVYLYKISKNLLAIKGINNLPTNMGFSKQLACETEKAGMRDKKHFRNKCYKSLSKMRCKNINFFTKTSSVSYTISSFKLF